MRTTYDAIRSPRSFVSIKPVGPFARLRVAFREWRERRTVHATLSGLSDGELLDIGTTRGEIDYVSSHRDIDPRGIMSAESVENREKRTAVSGPPIPSSVTVDDFRSFYQNGD
jgi:uncharacterized protein YjiS (DUF1127 family)